MNTVAEKIRAEIAQSGAISFARFMELALYCPLYGYYEKKEDTPGRRGDFYTSVSVGPVFGQMLAYQFAEWHREHGTPARLRLVEAGSHDGRLAVDILEWLKQQRPEIFEHLEYCIVEPSATRRGWQKEALASFGSTVRWAENVAMDGSKTERYAIVFSNELLDAFPVHRIGWDAKVKQWFEWGVGADQDRFVWTRLPFTQTTFHLSAELLDALPDGFTTEVCPAAQNWWRDAAKLIHGGKLLTFDYGLETEEFFSPQRVRGTLRAYHQHRQSDDVLTNPGEQDITTHVNFTTIRQEGEAYGLKTETDSSQAQFLTRIADKIWRGESGFGEWTPKHTRQFQTLTHPNHLGRAFRILVQSRGT